MPFSSSHDATGTKKLLQAQKAASEAMHKLAALGPAKAAIGNVPGSGTPAAGPLAKMPSAQATVSKPEPIGAPIPSPAAPKPIPAPAPGTQPAPRPAKAPPMPKQMAANVAAPAKDYPYATGGSPQERATTGYNSPQVSMQRRVDASSQSWPMAEDQAAMQKRVAAPAQDYPVSQNPQAPSPSATSPQLAAMASGDQAASREPAAPAQPVQNPAGAKQFATWDQLPPEARAKYQQNLASGKTKLTQDQALEYWNKNYQGNQGKQMGMQAAWRDASQATPTQLAGMQAAGRDKSTAENKELANRSWLQANGRRMAADHNSNLKRDARTQAMSRQISTNQPDSHPTAELTNQRQYSPQMQMGANPGLEDQIRASQKADELLKSQPKPAASAAAPTAAATPLGPGETRLPDGRLHVDVNAQRRAAAANYKKPHTGLGDDPETVAYKNWQWKNNIGIEPDRGWQPQPGTPAYEQAKQRLIAKGTLGSDGTLLGKRNNPAGNPIATTPAPSSAFSKRSSCSCSKSKPRRITNVKFKSKMNKRAAVEAMSLYLDLLIQSRPLGEKRSAVCRINAIINELERTGNLFTALEEVYPEKTASERAVLGIRLVRGLSEKLAMLGQSTHPSQGVTGMSAGGTSGVRVSTPTSFTSKPSITTAPAKSTNTLG